jgi:hypothetical protein
MSQNNDPEVGSCEQFATPRHTQSTRAMLREETSTRVILLHDTTLSITAEKIQYHMLLYIIGFHNTLH